MAKEIKQSWEVGMVGTWALWTGKALKKSQFTMDTEGSILAVEKVLSKQKPARPKELPSVGQLEQTCNEGTVLWIQTSSA